MNNDYDTKPAHEAIDRIWELAAKMRTCMLITAAQTQLNARPMSAHVKREDHAIYFLDKTGSPKEIQIAENPSVMLAFVDNDANKFISIRGTAEVTNDRALIKDLWNSFYKAWWDSEDDPEIRVITFRPESGELWDGLNNLMTSGAMLVSAVTGNAPKLGENAKVNL
ncbi:MAG TPA: pyridoxamine 5'-phosphate oxidase family protein [Patescibacteria group bacterium]|nr:pyridoxamine 5'-phosphate oxidase family protein [Patescibacteria group bacterium]